VTAPPAAPAGPPPRRRTARGDGGRLRTEILTAATELLDETGDEGAVTLRAVARRVGVSAPALYTHFDDRQEILLAVVRGAFAELAQVLATAGPPPDGPGTTTPAETDDADAAGGGGAARAAAHLRAVCGAYLAFAAERPQRYRVMFGGLWSAQGAVEEAALSAEEATALGRDALVVLVEALQACVDAGASTSAHAPTDAVALWVGLHGLAHQRAVAPGFPWPPGIDDRLVATLARLTAPAPAR